MFVKSTISVLAFSMVGIALPVGHQALAQVSEPAAGQGDDGVIIVTAQRRSERLQDIPASISAIDSKAIKATGILDISNVAPRVPGFYAGGFGTSRPQLYIRGIGTRQFDPGSESSVGVFVDESYLGRTGGVLGSLKDIERIEVLKGPQGTLYGRNTIGGAINVITKRPTDYFSAEAEAGFGNYGSYDLFAAISGPIAGDVLLGRVAAWRSVRDGYVTNLTTGGDAMGLDNYGGRLRLQLNPAHNVKIDLIGEIARDSGTSFLGESVGNTANPDAVFLSPFSGSQIKSDDPFRQFYTTDPEYDRNIDSLSLRTEFEFSPGSLVLVSSYRKLSNTDDRDFDNTSLDVIRQQTFERSRQFTQEVRFVSDTNGALSLGGAVDWIIGAFYYTDESFRIDSFPFGLDSVPGFLSGSAQLDTISGDYDGESYSVFGQATIHLGSTLDLTVGGRYNHDSKSAAFVATTTDVFPFLVSPFNVDNPEATYKSFDPKAVLSYKPNGNLNLYASYSQGFKSGGFQFAPLNAPLAGFGFGPENVDAYEIGMKSVLIDRALTLNAALFRYDYSNIQVSRVSELPNGSFQTAIASAGKSRIKGFEIEATARPSGNITFNASYAYTDAKYLDYIASAGVDFSGTTMVRAPKHSVNVSSEYRIPLAGEMSLTLRADYALLSDFYHEPGQGEARFGTTIPLTREEGYGLGNARVTFDNGDWSVSAWVKNVFDTTYRNTVLANPGQVINFYGLPRTYGVVANVSF